MLLANFTNKTSHELRITQEISQLLIVVDSTKEIKTRDLNAIQMTIFLESSGKNIDIAQRIPLSKLVNMSRIIDSIPTITKLEKTNYFPLSLFNGGNFKLSDSDALIVRFENMNFDASDVVKIYGIVDFETCDSLFTYQEKTMLPGEKEKLYDLMGIERVSVAGDFIEIGFFIQDENGKTTERKFTKEELEFQEIVQIDTNAYTKAELVDKSHSEEINLHIDGVEEMKVYAPTDYDYPVSIMMQSRTEVKTSSPKAIVETFNPSVNAVNQSSKGLNRKFLTFNK